MPINADKQRKYSNQNYNENYTENYTENYVENLNKTQMKILELIKKDRNITQKIMAEELKLSRGAITLNLKQLKDKNVIERIGSDKKGYWKILI